MNSLNWKKIDLHYANYLGAVDSVFQCKIAIQTAEKYSKWSSAISNQCMVIYTHNLYKFFV